MAENVNFYAAWQPVRIDAGLGSNQQGYTTGFSINSTGLQWTSTPGTNATNAFGGWLGKFPFSPHLSDLEVGSMTCVADACVM